jgi:alpha-galactosidase
MNTGSRVLKELVGIVMLWRDKPTGPRRTLCAVSTGRPRSEGRNQLKPNLGRPDVRKYGFQFLDKLLNENEIAFLDYNRNWSEPGWPRLLPRIRRKSMWTTSRIYTPCSLNCALSIPRVEIESCSGGGSRVDVGIMRYADQVWPSDNTDAFNRLLIQDGFTYAYAPGVMMVWVTDSPTWVNHLTLSLEYRFLSKKLGLGARLAPRYSKEITRRYRLILSLGMTPHAAKADVRSGTIRCV